MEVKLRSSCVLAVLILCSVGIAHSIDAQSAASPPPASLIARNAAIALKVPRYDSAVRAVTGAAAANAAQVMDSRTYVDDKGRRHGWLRLRVDASKFDALLYQIHSVGVLFSDSVVGEDQESDFESSGRRADQLALHEQRLVDVLNGPRRLRGSDILYIQDRMFRAGTEEQDLLQQRLDMERRARTGLVRS